MQNNDRFHAMWQHAEDPAPVYVGSFETKGDAWATLETEWLELIDAEAFCDDPENEFSLEDMKTEFRGAIEEELNPGVYWFRHHAETGYSFYVQRGV